MGKVRKVHRQIEKQINKSINKMIIKIKAGININAAELTFQVPVAGCVRMCC